MKLGSFEKDKRSSVELVKLFEITRVAFLSANSDPKEYGQKWRKAVEQIRESYEELDVAGRELKNFIEKKLLEHRDVSDPTSPQARELYEDIKLIRYKSDVVIDPFAK